MKLESDLKSTSNRFDKIFILLNSVQSQFPSCEKYINSIKRDFEVEVGALDLDKQEIVDVRRKLQEKTDMITDLEIKNLGKFLFNKQL